MCGASKKSMSEIVPALMPKTIEELRDKLALVRGAARYVQLEDCAHILPWEKPGALLEVARPFLLEAACAGVGA